MGSIGTLIDDIDAERLRPQSHTVCRRLVELEGIDDPLSAEIVETFDAGFPVLNLAMLTKLWEKIGALELGKQGRLRTLAALLQPDAPIDSYYADFLIVWARDAGVSWGAIDAAFRATS